MKETKYESSDQPLILLLDLQMATEIVTPSKVMDAFCSDAAVKRHWFMGLSPRPDPGPSSLILGPCNIIHETFVHVNPRHC